MIDPNSCQKELLWQQLLKMTSSPGNIRGVKIGIAADEMFTGSRCQRFLL
jgi:hypothetical protein